jgi:hypothetical protein
MATAGEAPPAQGSGGFPSRAGAVFGQVQPLFEDVWWAWGTTRFGPGILFPRNMVIVRERGELVIIHPILMPAAEQAKIEALGPIRHIVRLGAFHGMDDPAYVARYQPTTWAPPGVELRAGATNDRPLTPGGPLPFADGRLFTFERSRTPETAILLARHGGLLLACDSVQNWETTAGCSFLGGLMSRMMGFKGRACIGPGWRRIAEPRQGGGFGPDFRRLVDHDFRHAVGGHGPPMIDTARTDLRATVQRLYGSVGAVTV